MMAKVEETALATTRTDEMELAPTSGAAEKQFEIQSAIIIARRFPRDEDQAFMRLMKAARRSSFARDASYSFKRGRKKDPVSGRWIDNYVEGPSINIAREAARVWGNIRYGLEVVRDDDDTRQIRGWAWDLESNVKVTAEDDFKKLVQRKQYGADGKATGTAWIATDERELRELTNRRGAILIRNCILQLMPSDLIEDARGQCDQTLTGEIKKDPDGEKKRIILAFGRLNITPIMLEEKLGHSVSQCSPAEIVELRKIYKSIDDGNSTWGEYLAPKEPEKGELTVDKLRPGQDENRGHGQDGLDRVAEQDKTDQQSAGVKRGRGRPRKQAEPSGQDKLPEPDEAPLPDEQPEVDQEAFEEAIAESSQGYHRPEACGKCGAALTFHEEGKWGPWWSCSKYRETGCDYKISKSKWDKETNQ